MKKQSQAQRLYIHLRRKALSYMEMLMLGVSTCPHKRLKEGLHHLKPGERLDKQPGADGLIRYRVVRG